MLAWSPPCLDILSSALSSSRDWLLLGRELELVGEAAVLRAPAAAKPPESHWPVFQLADPFIKTSSSTSLHLTDPEKHSSLLSPTWGDVKSRSRRSRMTETALCESSPLHILAAQSQVRHPQVADTGRLEHVSPLSSLKQLGDSPSCEMISDLSLQYLPEAKGRSFQEGTRVVGSMFGGRGGHHLWSQQEIIRVFLGRHS